MDATDIGLLVLRLVTGLLFAVHGAQKTFGLWGGQGLRGWQGTIERLGYRPGYPIAVLTALAELVGGLLGWDATRRAAEVESYRREIAPMRRFSAP